MNMKQPKPERSLMSPFGCSQQMWDVTKAILSEMSREELEIYALSLFMGGMAVAAQLQVSCIEICEPPNLPEDEKTAMHNVAIKFRDKMNNRMKETN